MTDTWLSYWRSLADPEREQLKNIFRRFHGLIDGIYSDGTPRSPEVVLAVAEMQIVENEIVDAHAHWLRRTRARFDARGIPWTTVELARHVDLGGDG